MINTEIRPCIVNIVAEFCKNNKLNYKDTWGQIYITYGETYNIWPHIWYKFGSKSKLDFLEEYEELYGTMTKMYELIKELK